MYIFLIFDFFYTFFKEKFCDQLLYYIEFFVSKKINSFAIKMFKIEV